MADSNALAEAFELQRPRLVSVAWRMLGSRAEAEDVVQESWVRLTSQDASVIDNLGGWLTTVVSRICLDHLRSRTAHPVNPIDATHGLDSMPATDADPEAAAVLADSIGPALLVVLDALTPPERLAFVLHDLFAVPFTEIANALDTSPENARQLASRARRRVRGQDVTSDPDRQREIVRAFLLASQEGRFDDLIALLHPDVVIRADPLAAAMGAELEISGAANVAGFYKGRARAARMVTVDGLAGLAWAPGNKVKVVMRFTLINDRVSTIELIADPDVHALMAIELEPSKSRLQMTE